MEEKEKISVPNFILMIVVSEIMHQYTYMPILKTIPVNQDSWIQAIISLPYTLILGLPIMFLVNKFKGIPFFNMAKIIMGKLGGKITTFTLILFFLFCSTACLTLSAIFTRNYIFQNTPSVVFILFILIPVIYIALKGIRTISKMSGVVFMLVLGSIILFFLLGISKMDLKCILPILADSSFKELNIGALITAARFSDLLIIFTLAYRLEQPQKVKKVFISSVLLFVVLTIIMIFPVLTVLGVKFAQLNGNPYYTFTKQVEAFDFIQRVEVINMVCWLLGSITKISTYTYLSSFYLSKIFNRPFKKSYKPYVYISVLITFVSFIGFGLEREYIINNISSDAIMPYMVPFFIVVIPIIMVIVYSIRRKKIKQLINLNT